MHVSRAVAAVGLTAVACVVVIGLYSTSAAAEPVRVPSSPGGRAPVHTAGPVTTPPAMAPADLAGLTELAESLGPPTPVCATTRDVRPAGAPLRATALTSNDTEKGCPQSRG